jgi:hypothetical protein
MEWNLLRPLLENGQEKHIGRIVRVASPFWHGSTQAGNLFDIDRPYQYHRPTHEFLQGTELGFYPNFSFYSLEQERQSSVVNVYMVWSSIIEWTYWGKIDEFHGDPFKRICNDLFAKMLLVMDVASLSRSVSIISRKWKFVGESHVLWELFSCSPSFHTVS